jgi:flagellar assembly protein FliH
MALHEMLFLFPENFEEPRAAPAPPPPAEPPPPVLTEADVIAAREAGFAEGYAQGRAAATAEGAGATAEALAAVAARLADARAEAARCAEAAATALARLVFDAIGAGYPALRERFGEAELGRFVSALLPALAREPDVEVRVHPAHAAALAETISGFGAPSGQRPAITPSAEVAPGDAVVVWRDGRAQRDAAAAWSAVAAALAPLGLISPPAPDGALNAAGER